MYTAIIVSAGSGQRMKLGFNKVFYKINGITIIEHSVNSFCADPSCKEIIIASSKDDKNKMEELFCDNPLVKIIIGGITRQESVYNGLLNSSYEYVLIHDGARPNIKTDIIKKTYKELEKNKAVIVCHKAKDSVLIKSNDKVDKYLERDNICLVETPQAFHKKEIISAHEKAVKLGNYYTDDASLYIGETQGEVKLIYNEAINIKATTKEDLIILEDLL